MAPQLPSHARAVIVGGGVVGTSVAYHLAKLGWKDVVLLERKMLTCGTTWHAAGLVAQLRASQNLTRLAKYSGDLYRSLEEETGVATGMKTCGSITVALTHARMEELRRTAAMARSFDVEVDVITPDEVAALYEGLNINDVVGGVYLPKDGQADPVNVTQALAKGARNNGVSIFENTKVTGVRVENHTAVGVDTEQGYIAADVVVNCGGMWARELGALAGVSVPLHACEHFYILTEGIPGLKKGLPVLRVPDECAYYKEDAGKLLLGAFEPKSKPWGMEGIPEDFCFDALEPDFDHFEPILEQASERLPILQSAGIHTFFNGPESFTPDNNYHLGESPECKNFFVAAGFNSIGIQSAGGAGMALAELMHTGKAPMDLWDIDIKRMQPFQRNRAYLQERVSETLGLLYADHWPYRQPATARGVRRSPIHDRLAAQGACFGEHSGWERANWYLPQAAKEAGAKAEYEYSWSRQNWFEYSAEEHKAIRENVGMFDLSSFGKITVAGPDAEDVLQKVAANNVAVAPGQIVYTQFLNVDGHIEADVTVTRLDYDKFLVVTPAMTIRRDLDWIQKQIPAEARCVALDCTASESVMAIMGPEARDFLQSLTPHSLSNEDFPFGTAQTIEMGFGLVRAHRVTYVGELGWELYATSDMALHIMDAIQARSEEHPLRLCGLHALDSCRIEKGYRHFGHDIANDDHVLEAGLGFATKTKKPMGRYGHFTGRDAVLQKKETGLQCRLMQFQLEDPMPLLYHHEGIIRDGQHVGYLTSGNYGHHLGGAIGLGYVPCVEGEKAAAQLGSEYMIDVGGQQVKARASLKPMYDPQSQRVKM